MANVIEDVACAGCCCVCDDIRVTTDGHQLIDAQTDCSQGQIWFQQSQQISKLTPQINGKDIAKPEAVKQAVELIQKAKSPLIFGMSQSATDAQRAAVCLADQIGATIDTGASPATRALQQVGEAPCTLGEVRDRADLIIYWGANSLFTNECHRRSLVSKTAEVPRKTVVMGSELPSDCDGFDQLIQLESQNEFEVIWSLRALLQGRELSENVPAGISVSDLEELAHHLQQSKYIVFFYGPEFKQGHLSHRKIEALSLLVREIQSDRRCHAISVPCDSETKGAENVLAWQTGYAANVNFAAGYPRYSPGEYSANRLLEQGEIDLCILVGAQSTAGLSQNARQRLADIPVILVGPVPVDDLVPEVYIPTGIYGIHFPGVVYRFDGTPLPLRSLIPTTQLSEADVLSEFTSELN